VGSAQRYCFAHDPANAEERSKNSAKAARMKPNRDLQALKDEVRSVVKEVKDGELDRNDAKVMLSGYSLVKDIIALEREMRIDDELTAEMEELKREIERNIS
jgi:hypothetical protein